MVRLCGHWLDADQAAERGVLKMADHFLIKTKGGPEDGATRVIPRDMYGWPDRKSVV